MDVARQDGTNWTACAGVWQGAEAYLVCLTTGAGAATGPQKRRGALGPELGLWIFESEYAANQKCLGGQSLTRSQMMMLPENGEQLLKFIVFITNGLQFGFTLAPSLFDSHRATRD